MKLCLHNKLEIKTNNSFKTFHNNMFNSVFDKLENLEAYNLYVAIGNGNSSSEQNNYKLTNHLKTFKLETETIQNDIASGALYIKKSLLIDDHDLDGICISELGLCSSEDDNPIIYNYFSLVDDNETGISKNINEPILIYIYINLELSYDGIGLFTSGKNPFISFLLGEGLSGKSIFAIRGNNLSDNVSIKRANINSIDRFPCELNVNKDSENLILNFSSNLLQGKTYEIVFTIENEPFARINVINLKSTIQSNISKEPKTNYVIDLGEDVSNINSITNNSTNEEENNYYITKYANEFGDRVALPFNNLFSAESPRFISKDGNKIFFVMNDTIYGFENKNYDFIQMNLSDLHFQNIIKIICFENFLFVITKQEPYIEAFIFENNIAKKCNFNIKTCEIYSKMANLSNIDITLSKSNVFMIGFISADDNIGHTIYLTYLEGNNTFEFSSYLETPYAVSFMLAMYKNNFSDAVILYLKEGDYSLYCRIINHYPDKSSTDNHSTLAYFYTKDTKNIYTKSRAVIVEKTTSPFTWIYYYQQIYRYTLSIFENEHKIYISNNLLYLIQQQDDNSYKIFNLVGYDALAEFNNGLPSDIDQNKILDFEFLSDTLLIFMDDKKESIIAYNLKESNTCIENVSSNTDNYTISCNKYNLIGTNNEGVIAKLTIKISL